MIPGVAGENVKVAAPAGRPVEIVTRVDADEEAPFSLTTRKTTVNVPVVVTNVVHAAAQQLDLNLSNNTAVAVTTVTPVTDLAITAVSSPATVLLGQSVTYTVQITNLGPNLASGIIVSDLLPDGIGLVSAVPSQGTCANLAGSLTCAVGSLASGASASVTIVARAGAVGPMTNLLTVAGDQFDQASGNNLALAVNNIVPAADNPGKTRTTASSISTHGKRKPLPNFWRTKMRLDALFE